MDSSSKTKIWVSSLQDNLPLVDNHFSNFIAHGFTAFVKTLLASLSEKCSSSLLLIHPPPLLLISETWAVNWIWTYQGSHLLLPLRHNACNLLPKGHKGIIWSCQHCAWTTNSNSPIALSLWSVTTASATTACRGLYCALLPRAAILFVVHACGTSKVLSWDDSPVPWGGLQYKCRVFMTAICLAPWGIMVMQWKTPLI